MFTITHKTVLHPYPHHKILHDLTFFGIDIMLDGKEGVDLGMWKNQ